MEIFNQNITEKQIEQAKWNAEIVYVYECVGVYCLFHSQEEAAKNFCLAPSTIRIYCNKFANKSKNKFLKELTIILKTKEDIEIEIQKPKKIKRHYAYLMKNERGYYKVGKSNNPNSRKNQLNYQSSFGINYTILYTWEFLNEEDAYEMEIWLHRYFRKLGGELHGQDHFINIYKEIDYNFLDKKAEEIKENSQKWLDKIA